MILRHLLAATALLLPSFLAAQPVGKHLLLEKITSAGCPSCPNGDLILQNLLAADTSLIPVAIHVNNPGHIDHMFTADGDAILADYLWAHPTVMVDRYKFPGLQYVAGTSGSWASMIQARKAQPMVGTIGGRTSYNPGDRMLNVHLEGEILWNLDWDVRLNAYIVENDVTGVGLGYDQLNGNNTTQGHPLQGLGDPIVGYHHHWVLRDMLGGPEGETAFPRPIAAGHTFSHDFLTQLDSAIDESQVYVILVLQRFDADKELREVLNVAKVGLNASIAAGTATPAHTPLLTLWPSPAAADGALHVQTGAPAAWRAEIVDLQGRVLHAAAFSGSETTVDLPRLAAGAYLLRLSAPGQAPTSRLFHIQ